MINKSFLAKLILTCRICICLQLYFFENQVIAAGSIYTASSNPAHGASMVPVNSNLIMTFNQAWVLEGNVGSITIYNSSDNSIFERYNFPSYPANITGAGTITLTIDPTSDFLPGRGYYVVIDGSIMETVSGNREYEGTYGSPGWPWYFSTLGCYNPPSCLGPCFSTSNIQHLSPPDNARFMQSYEGLSVVFANNVTIGTGNIYIRQYNDDITVETMNISNGRITGWGTNTLTINPVINLANDTHYYINFDIEGWSLPADKDNWDFWTKATPNTFSGAGL